MACFRCHHLWVAITADSRLDSGTDGYQAASEHQCRLLRNGDPQYLGLLQLWPHSEREAKVEAAIQSASMASNELTGSPGASANDDSNGLLAPGTQSHGGAEEEIESSLGKQLDNLHVNGAQECRRILTHLLA
jgi:hypothetical protein